MTQNSKLVAAGDTFNVREILVGGDKGFWLWDDTRSMNLSMRAPTAEAAYHAAIVYYQKHLAEVETELRNLKSAVNWFVAQVSPPAEDDQQ